MLLFQVFLAIICKTSVGKDLQRGVQTDWPTDKQLMHSSYTIGHCLGCSRQYRVTMSVLGLLWTPSGGHPDAACHSLYGAGHWQPNFGWIFRFFGSSSFRDWVCSGPQLVCSRLGEPLCKLLCMILYTRRFYYKKKKKLLSFWLCEGLQSWAHVNS